MSWRMFFLFLWILPVPVFGEKIWSENNGEGFSIEVRIPNTHISLVDELILYVTLTYPDTYHPNLQSLRSHLLYHSLSVAIPFTLLASEEQPPKKSADQSLIQELTFKLDPQIAGRQRLTFLGIDFTANDSTKPSVTLVSPIMEVEVIEPKMNDEKPMVSPLMTFSTTLPVDLDDENRRVFRQPDSTEKLVHIFKQREIPWLGLIALVAALIFIFKFGKPQIETKKISAKALLTAKMKALHNLAELQKQRASQPDAFFYERLTLTMRRFIEERYQIKAQSMTTEEFLREQALHPVFSVDEQMKLKSFLENADKIKYAQAKSSNQESQAALSLAIELINASF